LSKFFRVSMTTVHFETFTSGTSRLLKSRHASKSRKFQGNEEVVWKQDIYTADWSVDSF
jgi:hypothetical protein